MALPTTTTMVPSTCQRAAPGLVRIEAIVDPARLEDLKVELAAFATTLSWCEVNWYVESAHRGTFRGMEYVVDSVQMLRMEVVVPTLEAARAVDALERAVLASPVGGQVLPAVQLLDELVSVGARARRRR